MSNLSDYTENKLIDALLRGQAFASPATLYVALMTAGASDAGGGTEVAGGSYARAAVTASLANFSGTQGPGTTSPSSGNTGQASNNVAITFPAPTANWGTVLGVAVYDQATGGNLLFFGALASPKTISSGDAAPSFPAASLSLTLA